MSHLNLDSGVPRISLGLLLLNLRGGSLILNSLSLSRVTNTLLGTLRVQLQVLRHKSLSLIVGQVSGVDLWLQWLINILTFTSHVYIRLMLINILL
jgi:hypothetical protein